MRWLLFFIFISAGKVHTLYNSLDPTSISEHLAFYELYPETPEGKASLEHTWKLLTGKSDSKALPHLSPAAFSLVSLITREPVSQKLTPEEVSLINKAAARLPNRKLKGWRARTESDVLALPSEEIDLSHGLLLSLGSEDPDSYEAMLDLMALQILAKLTPDASDEDKIEAINTLVFDEMGFRFPPHSLYSEEIDLYTLLPAVLDSRRGVCLGVSILYLALGQRLDLPLEIVTPPGHIYVCLGERNIETTARGVHIDSEDYLSIDTRSLQKRTLKEVIGMAHFNDAGRWWHAQDHEKVKQCYNKARAYTPDDMLLLELMGYNAAILNEPHAKELLTKVKGHIPDYAVSGENVAEDYLLGNVDGKGIETLFLHVDEKLESIKEKQKKIQESLAQYPNFRSGIFALATTWLQLHRMKEALIELERYHALDPTNPTVEYYLSALYMMRFDYNKAWKHYRITEKLAAARDHHPKTLKELRLALNHASPEP